MTGREITTMAFELKEPPRVPVTVIGGGARYVDMAGETFAGIKNDPRRMADVFVKAFREIGHDLLWTGSNFINYPIHFLGCPIKDDSSDGPALEGTVIQKLEERDALDLDRVLNHPTMQGIIHSQHLVADEVGREAMVMPTSWGPLSMAARILGVEAMMMATVLEPEGLLELISFSTELIWAIADRVMEHEDMLGLNLSEPVASGDMISPDNFRTFSKPFLKEIVDRARAKGKYSMVHICGDTTKVLEDISEIGVHCFSLETKVDLKTAKSVIGGRVCVAGNVSPTGPFLSGTPEEVISEAEACVEAWGHGGGYVLTLGCDFPKTVPLENIKALMSLKKV